MTDSTPDNMDGDQPTITNYTTSNAVSPEKESKTSVNSSTSHISGNKHNREVIEIDNIPTTKQCTANNNITMGQQSMTATINTNQNNNDDTSDIELSMVEINHYTDLVATDRNLRKHVMMRGHQSISIQSLMSENAKDIPRDGYIDLQLLRIVANSYVGNGATALRYYARNNNNNTESKNYSRLFLCKVVRKDENDLLVYMMESSNVNNNLWQRNLQYRDNGIMTIGTIFRVFHPLPIKKMMANEIPMIETRYSVVVMNYPVHFHQSPVDITIGGNTSRAFVLNNCYLNILSVTPEQTKCGGLFCDRQRIHDIAERKQGCGCYSMLARRSSLVLDHAMTISHEDEGWEFTVENFSSNKFSLLFQNKPFPYSMQLEQFSLSNDYFELLNCMRSILDDVNAKGGWTVIGWYKRGVINDQTLVGSDGSNSSGGFRQGNQNPNLQVDNAAINYHVCYLKPTEQKLMDVKDIEGLNLHVKKFDVDEMQIGGN